MNTLVIGANGFLGSKVVEILPENHNVFAIVRSDILNFEKRGNIKILKQDLSNLDLNVFPPNIDIIFYLAQSRNYKRFPEYADEILNINLIVPMKIIQWGIKNNVKKFVYTSTGGIYNLSSTYHKEYSIINANQQINFYLSSKLSAEIILRNYSDYFESFIILRPFFIYGPKQNINMLIPQLIKKVYYNEEITIEGKKGIKINPIYIEDAALATMKTINLKGKHIINIAGNEIINMKEIILNIAHILNKKPRIKTVESKKISLIADITEMKQKLLTPQTKFKEGLEKTVDFYKKIL